MLKTQGIVFRSIRYKESSLILDVYTESSGLQSFIVNSVFSKSDQRLASVLQAMNLIDLVAYYNENKDLHRIKEVQRDVIYQRIPFDIKRSATGQFMLEICRKAIRTKDPHQALFKFIHNSFLNLDQQHDFNPNQHIKFMLRLSSHLGFYPHNNYSTTNDRFDLANGVFTSVNSKDSYLLDLNTSAALKIMLCEEDSLNWFQNAQQRRDVLKGLLLFYQLHIEHFGTVNSIDVFQEIL